MKIDNKTCEKFGKERIVKGWKAIEKGTYRLIITCPVSLLVFKFLSAYSRNLANSEKVVDFTCGRACIMFINLMDSFSEILILLSALASAFSIFIGIVYVCVGLKEYFCETVQTEESVELTKLDKKALV